MTSDSRPPIPAFVISLEETPGRDRQALTALHDQGIKAQHWPAIDGRHCQSIDELPWREGEGYAWTSCLRRGGKHMSFREMACCLSHYRLLQHAFEQGLERVAVFEDDCVPKPGLKAILAELQTLDSSFECVNLHGWHPDIDIQIAGRNRQDVFEARRLSDDRMLYRSIRRIYGGMGYVIHRRGLEKVMACAMPMSCPMDLLLCDPVKSDIRYFLVAPYPISKPDPEQSVSLLDAHRHVLGTPPLWNLHSPEAQGAEKFIQRGLSYALRNTTTKMFNWIWKAQLSRYRRACMNDIEASAAANESAQGVTGKKTM